MQLESKPKTIVIKISPKPQTCFITYEFDLASRKL